MVTGCSSGIGHHCALALAERGWRVVGTLRSDRGRGALERAGVELVHADLSDGAAAEAAVAAAAHRHGRLDALVANAGYGLYGCFEDLSPAEIRTQMEVNFFGTLACARGALPPLRRGRGRLVVVGSIAGRRAAPGSSAYNASKFALEGWAEALRHELAPLGVTVVLVEPGLTRTAFHSSRLRGAAVGRGVYGAITRRLDQLHGESHRKAAPVASSVRTVLQALHMSRPPLRLVPTASAQAELLAARLLPWRLYEALVKRALRLPTG